MFGNGTYIAHWTKTILLHVHWPWLIFNIVRCESLVSYLLDISSSAIPAFPEFSGVKISISLFLILFPPYGLFEYIQS